MSEKKDQRITVRITDSQWKEIQLESNSKNKSASEVVRDRINRK